MKILFQKKRIWKKIAIILLLLLLFQIIIVNPVHAEAGSLLEPVTSLFANLGDGIMEIMQKTFLGVESSGAWIENNGNVWAKILTIAIAIAVAVTIIAATIITAGAAGITLTLIASTAGAIAKVAGVGAIAYFAVSTLNLGGTGFYLPEYELTLQAILEGKVAAFDVNFFNPSKELRKDDNKTPASIANELQPTISSWYKTLRNIALVGLLSVLVYIGIRIILSSAANDKAKYKQMLGDWVIALCLVFMMHYIMSFAVTINSKIVDAISSIVVKGYGSTEDFVDGRQKEVVATGAIKQDETKEELKGMGVQVFTIEGEDAQEAYKTLVYDDDEDHQDKDRGKNSPFFKWFEFEDGADISGDYPESSNVKRLYWFTNDFMAQARLLGQDIGEDETQTLVARSGYNIVYVVLVIYTIIFCFTYLKRVIYMAFLTLISPLVAITYPIDKAGDGKAQAFNMWLKEYIFNLLLQPIHLILYMILIGIAMKLAATNIFYTVVAIGFLVPAEKMLRRFFGFEKAQTPGMFGGPAATALMTTGMNKLLHRRPKNRERERDDSEKENTKINTYNNGKDPLEGLNGGTNGAQEEVSNSYDSQKSNRQFNNPDTSQNADDGLGANFVPINLNNTSTRNNSMKNDSNNSNSNNTNDKKPSKRRKISRAIHRGAANYKAGIEKRYKRNKKLKGSWARRALKTTTGLAGGATLATAAGLIGIASGDPSKVAQYMAAGAVGGYHMGKAGIDKTAEKLKEQYKEPLKEAKIGYYGESEYEKREHEKFKKMEFEKNAENIAKVQDAFDVSWKEAKEISKQMSMHTETKGVNSFKDALAVEKMIRNDNMTVEDARMSASYSDTVLDRQNLEKMKRSDRLEYQQDLIDRLVNSGVDRKKAIETWKKVYSGSGKYSKYTK